MGGNGHADLTSTLFIQHLVAKSTLAIHGLYFRELWLSQHVLCMFVASHRTACPKLLAEVACAIGL